MTADERANSATDDNVSKTQPLQAAKRLPQEPQPDPPPELAKTAALPIDPEIENIWARGYRIDTDNKEIIAHLEAIYQATVDGNKMLVSALERAIAENGKSQNKSYNLLVILAHAFSNGVNAFAGEIKQGLTRTTKEK